MGIPLEPDGQFTGYGARKYRYVIFLNHSTWVHDVGQTGIAAVRVVVRICTQQIIVNWICDAGVYCSRGETGRARKGHVPIGCLKPELGPD